MTGAVAFAGYAAVFDRVDRAGDVIRAGAFADCASVPLLLQHRGAPVGTLSSVSEDRQGLRVAGVVTDPQVAALLRRRALTGLSVGYWARAVLIIAGSPSAPTALYVTHGPASPTTSTTA